MALVLIVDDSPTDQHVLSQALQRHGFDTHGGERGQARRSRSRSASTPT